MKFQARTSDNCKLEVNWDRVNTYLSQWKPGTVLDIEIVKRVPRKSNPLRAYYFGAVMPPIADYAGYEKSEILDLHKFMKIRYFNVKPDKWGVYRKKDIPSVFSDESELKVPEKKAFVDHVIRQAAKLGVYVPNPGE
jgi:hypothetical protein